MTDSAPNYLPLVPSRHKGNIAALDILRGGAALYVAAFHSVAVLTAAGRDFDHSGGSARMIRHGNMLGLLGFGLYAVLAFFVVSGFVIHLRQAQRPEELVRQGMVRWTASYGWRRFMRIYPPLLGAIALTGVIAVLGLHLSPGLYGPVTAHTTRGFVVINQGTLTQAIGVLVPLHGSQTYGADGSLWSIAFEMWFYVAYVFILLMTVRLSRIRGLVRMGTALAASLVLASLLLLARDDAPRMIPAHLRPWLEIIIYFPAWMAGAFLAELYASGVQLSRSRLVLLPTAGVLLVVAAANSNNGFRPQIDLLWCVAICLVIVVVTCCPATEWYTRPVGLTAAKTAAWSYSLYLVHLPVIVFVYGVLSDNTHSVTNPLIVLTVFSTALMVGWLFYQVIERPSMSLVKRRQEVWPRRKMKGSWDRRRSRRLGLAPRTSPKSVTRTLRR